MQGITWQPTLPLTFEKKLKVVARLISGGLKTKFYLVSMMIHILPKGMRTELTPHCSRNYQVQLPLLWTIFKNSDLLTVLPG